LLQGEAEVEEEDADDRIVEPRVEEDAEGDEEGEVAVEGDGHENFLSHGSKRITAG
jgi:hypothetical protein